MTTSWEQARLGVGRVPGNEHPYPISSALLTFDGDILKVHNTSRYLGSVCAPAGFIWAEFEARRHRHTIAILSIKRSDYGSVPGHNQTPIISGAPFCANRQFSPAVLDRRLLLKIIKYTFYEGSRSITYCGIVASQSASIIVEIKCQAWPTRSSIRG